MTIYYLVRHGQTEWNVEGRSQGQLDSPLTPEGLAQARLHARTLADVPITRAYCSPLERAQTTARIILEGRDIPLTVLDELAELDHGEAAGLLKTERKDHFPEVARRWKRDRYNTVLPGGESYATAAPRAARALKRIKADGPGVVLIVSHSQLGRLLLQHLLNLTPKQTLRRKHPQDTIYRVKHGKLARSVKGGKFRR